MPPPGSQSDAYTVAALQGFAAHPSVVPDPQGNPGAAPINPQMIAQQYPDMLAPGAPMPPGGFVPTQMAPTFPQMGATAQLLAKGAYAGAPTEQPQAMPIPQGQAAADAGDPAKVLKGMEGKEEEEEEEEEEEGKGKEGKKSITEADLLKAARLVETLAASAAQVPDQDPERDERMTLAKAWADGTLDEDGQERFANLIKAELPEADTTYAELSQMDPDVQAGHVDEAGFDISGWIGRQSAFVGGALDDLKSAMVKGIGGGDLVKAQGALLVAMAKQMAAQQAAMARDRELIKAMAIDIVALTQVAAPRRSAVSAAALQKAHFHGTGAPGLDAGVADPYHGLSREQVGAGLARMVHTCPNGIAPCGESLMQATAAFDCGQGLSKSLADDIRNTLGQRR